MIEPPATRQIIDSENNIIVNNTDSIKSNTYIFTIHRLYKTTKLTKETIKTLRNLLSTYPGPTYPMAQVAISASSVLKFFLKVEFSWALTWTRLVSSALYEWNSCISVFGWVHKDWVNLYTSIKPQAKKSWPSRTKRISYTRHTRVFLLCIAPSFLFIQKKVEESN